MYRFPIVSMALWLFVLGTGALFFWGSTQMAADYTSAALRRDAPSTATPAELARKDLPKLTAIDFDATRSTTVGVAELESDAPPVKAALPARVKVIVSASSLNLRALPNSKSPKVVALRQGEALEVLSAEGKWSQVRTQAGATGWAFSQYLSPSP